MTDDTKKENDIQTGNGIMTENEKEKGVRAEILELGIPSFLETLFTTFSSIIDSKMVSVMGISAISAVSVTNQPRLFVFSIYFAICTVTSSLVAKYLGKNDRDEANRVFDIVVKFTIVSSIILGVITALLARPIMVAFSNQPDTLNDSIRYFQIVMLGMITNTVFIIINAALRGCGLTKMTFISNVVSCTVNIFCDYLLIGGNLGFPALGITGAALATVIGNVAATVMCVVFAMNKNLFVNIPYCIAKKYKITKDSIREVVSLCKNTILDNMALRVALLIVGGVAARIGSYDMSVYSVGMHLMNVNFALGSALQTSGIALIGRSYGAGDHEKMKVYKRNILMIGLVVSAVLSALIIVLRKFYFGFFSTDPKFVELGADTCLVIGVITFFQTLKFIYTGNLQAIGKMKDVMYASISCATVNVIAICVVVFGFHSGVVGVWIATLITQSIQSITLMILTKKCWRDF